MTEQEYYQHIRQWAHDRNIIEGLTPHSQFVKLVEEFSEIQSDPLDGIGDCLVVMTIICAMRGVDIEHLISMPTFNHDNPISALGLLAGDIARGRCVVDSMCNLITVIGDYCNMYHVDKVDCLAQAWNEIKDRKGIVREGVFIKSEDL